MDPWNNFPNPLYNFNGNASIPELMLPNGFITPPSASSAFAQFGNTMPSTNNQFDENDIDADDISSLSQPSLNQFNQYQRIQQQCSQGSGQGGSRRQYPRTPIPSQQPRQFPRSPIQSQGRSGNNLPFPLSQGQQVCPLSQQQQMQLRLAQQLQQQAQGQIGGGGIGSHRSQSPGQAQGSQTHFENMFRFPSGGNSQTPTVYNFNGTSYNIVLPGQGTYDINFRLHQ